jgi:hypothetical protein
LRAFLARSPAAARATRLLSRDARVDLDLGDEGSAHFTHEEGTPDVRPGGSGRPDFSLRVPRRAVERLTALTDDDVGELGVAFFGLVLEHDPALKVRIHLDASVARLAAHGYLAVLALGGVKVAWWLARHGIRDPRAAMESLRRSGRGAQPPTGAGQAPRT